MAKKSLSILKWGAFFFVLAAIACPETGTKFSLTSFIPEKFVDFQWRASGNFDINGNRSDNTNSYSSNIFRFEQGHSTHDQQNGSLHSTINYRNETPDRFLVLGAMLSTAIHNDNGRSDRLRTDTVDYREARYSTGGNSTFNFQFGPSAEWGRYLLSDLFGSLSISLNAGNEAVPEYDYAEFNSYYRGYPESEYVHMVSNDEGKERRNSHLYGLRASLAAGWGRLYDSRYAATALYIIDALRRAGTLRRDPDYSEMTRLTDLIYYYRLVKPIDSRLLKIESLTEIMTYLQDQGIADLTRRQVSPLIVDVWDYYPNYSRPFGYKARAGLGWQYSYDNRQTSRYGRETEFLAQADYDGTGIDTLIDETRVYDNYYSNRRESRTPYLFFNAEYSRPLSLRWQFDFDGGFTYNLNPRTTSQSFTNRFADLPEARYMETRDDTWANYALDLSGMVQYIFDSRTSGRAQAMYQFSHVNACRRQIVIDDHYLDYSEISRNDDQNGRLRMSAGLEYRLSIPTTLEINLSYSISSRETVTEIIGDTDSQGYNFNIGLNHYLF